jgi:WD40 repeat protein
VAASGDGRRIAAAYLGADNRAASKATEPPTIFVWDTAGGEPIARLAGHKQPVIAIALSPDGRRLVSGDTAYEVRAWDVDGGKELGRPPRSGSVTLSLAFAPQGSLAAVTTGDGVMISEVGGTEPKQLTKLTTPRGNRERDNDRTLAVAFSPDGKRFAAVTLSWLYVWDVDGSEFRNRRRAKEPNEWSFSSVGFSADGREAITCDSNGTNYIRWDLAGAEPKPQNGVPRVDVPQQAVPTSIAGLTGGKRLLVSKLEVVKTEPFAFDGVARPPILIPQGEASLREIGKGEPLFSFNAYHGALFRDGTSLVTTGNGSRREQVVLWDIGGGEAKEIRVFSPPATK